MYYDDTNPIPFINSILRYILVKVIGLKQMNYCFELNAQLIWISFIFSVLLFKLIIAHRQFDNHSLAKQIHLQSCADSDKNILYIDAKPFQNCWRWLNFMEWVLVLSLSIQVFFSVEFYHQFLCITYCIKSILWNVLLCSFQSNILSSCRIEGRL